MYKGARERVYSRRTNVDCMLNTVRKRAKRKKKRGKKRGDILLRIASAYRRESLSLKN